MREYFAAMEASRVRFPEFSRVADCPLFSEGGGSDADADSDSGGSGASGFGTCAVRRSQAVNGREVWCYGSDC